MGTEDSGFGLRHIVRFIFQFVVSVTEGLRESQRIVSVEVSYEVLVIIKVRIGGCLDKLDKLHIKVYYYNLIIDSLLIHVFTSFDVFLPFQRSNLASTILDIYLQSGSK